MNIFNFCLAKHISSPQCCKLDTFSLSQYIHQHYKLVIVLLYHHTHGRYYSDIITTYWQEAIVYEMPVPQVLEHSLHSLLNDCTRTTTIKTVLHISNFIIVLLGGKSCLQTSYKVITTLMHTYTYYHL